MPVLLSGGLRGFYQFPSLIFRRSVLTIRLFLLFLKPIDSFPGVCPNRGGWRQLSFNPQNGNRLSRGLAAGSIWGLQCWYFSTNGVLPYPAPILEYSIFSAR
ncbi:UNVERIFIED_CONTAM: hypothetical protein Sangu_2568200 [Sesamum angustifolium]|uniref:Uncharacterized protein n=1 Tax=Sesamum angustifolium TaxID=2727405 RepID=A0AAW2J8C7_9LAMI